MKKITIVFLLGAFFVLSTTSLKAQETPSGKKMAELLEEEDEGPMMYRFEPDYLTSLEQRKVKIEQTRAILDTLDISDRKRRRLLKELYKNGISERLSKALYTETKFEDEAEIDN